MRYTPYVNTAETERCLRDRIAALAGSARVIHALE
jgi:hypothetical protein